MKNKFEFYEIVKVIGDGIALKKAQGCNGIIKAMAQDEITGKWAYGVLIHDMESVWHIDEEHLESTGKKANPDDYKPVDTIKVRVNPETGEGEIVEDEEE